jgi:predicted 3-demethylubiquinone-9 3-methyltransferase (glyoxalase superfamily)
MQKITPFLWFDKEAEEAATFYTSVFKNSKLGRIARYGEAGPGEPGSVMTVEFSVEGMEFVALNAGPLFQFNESVSFVINCKSQEEVDYYWEKLTADGGEESMCGWLKDKFGLSWQVTPTRLIELTTDKDPGVASRAMGAMMKMRKIDIKKIEEAALGRK